MILDLNELGRDVFEADLCIVGSGAMGICLAREFFGGAIRVVVLEAGERKVTEAQQELYKGDSTGNVFSVDGSRFRAVGGSTERWGGQALPLDPLDFAQRPWIPNAGWDIGIDDVSNYFARAEDYMGVAALDFNENTQELAREKEAFDPAIIHYHHSKVAPEPRMAVKYREELKSSENVTVIYNANVVDIDLVEAESCVREMEVVSLQGRRAKVKAAQFVLAAGALETARILLYCNRQRKAGIGNENDLVGRYLQDHPGQWVGEIVGDSRTRLSLIGGLFKKNGVQGLKRISAGETFQREQQTVNVSATVLFEFEPEDKLVKARKLAHTLRGPGEKGLREIAAMAEIMRPSLVARLLKGWRFQRQYQTNWNFGSRFVLALGAEQRPDPESRVSLSEERDRLGLPRIQVHWKVNDDEVISIQKFSRAIADEFKRLSLGRVDFYPFFDDVSELKARLLANNHHMGTTRMSASPKWGVVNTDGRLHSVQNLFVAGAAVFPIGGHSNPTFTALALTIRLAEHLRDVLTHKKTS